MKGARQVRPMLVMGVNKGRTLKGKNLPMGGIAIAQEGEVKFAIAEERVSGQKWAGGYDKSVAVALSDGGRTLGIRRRLHASDFDMVAVSTCCEGEKAALRGHMLENHPGIVSVNHHLSHASLAFFPSGFEKALVVVIDGGGNTLDEEEPEHWWECRREQHSYYIAEGRTLELVDQDFVEPRATGFGEIYRAFTYFLGWQSSRHAAKVMALSAYGESECIAKAPFVSLENGELHIPVSNDPRDPIGTVYRLGKAIGVDFGEPRQPNEEILPMHRDVATYVQRSLERALLAKLEWLVYKFGVRHLCLAGGFALNCVANGRLVQERLFDGVYIPSAPGDEGQALGNAIWASLCLADKKPHAVRPWRSSTSVQLGPTYRVNSATAAQLLKKHGLITSVAFIPSDLSWAVARLLKAGSAVCVYQGRSEAGPRALGQRSILGNPSGDNTRALFNQLKGREWFQPFAPSILIEETHEYFEVAHESPFMSFAIPVRNELRAAIPAVVHGDGTARLQTVDTKDKSLLRMILNHFHQLSGIPLVLNTSFNLQAQPIVETPEDAVRTFSNLSVNALVLDRFLVVKSLAPNFAESGLLPSLEGVDIAVVHDKQRTSPALHSSVREILRWIQHSTGQLVFVRSDFPLYREYLDWLRTGQKGTTIRFRKGGVEIPHDRILPLFPTADYGLTKLRTKMPQLKVKVDRIKYQRFRDLSQEDAKHDGFTSEAAMRGALTRIYPRMKEDDWVTVYSISLAEDTHL